MRTVCTRRVDLAGRRVDERGWFADEMRTFHFLLHGTPYAALSRVESARLGVDPHPAHASRCCVCVCARAHTARLGSQWGAAATPSGAARRAWARASGRAAFARAMASSLSAEEVAAYRRDGFIVPGSPALGVSLRGRSRAPGRRESRERPAEPSIASLRANSTRACRRLVAMHLRHLSVC